MAIKERLQQVRGFVSHRVTIGAIVLGSVLLAFIVVNNSWRLMESSVYDPITNTTRNTNFHWWNIDILSKFLLCLLPGFVVGGLKMKSSNILVYGIVESLLAVLALYASWSQFEFATVSSWTALATSSFFLMRGIENTNKGL